MRILFVGDVVGKPGRDAVLALAPLLREEFAPDLLIANAENAAAGVGVTPDIARRLLAGGMDVLTLGNHTWSRRDMDEFLACEPRVLRPANYPPGAPGRGHGVFRTPGGALVAIANLIGRVFMEPLDDPFRAADEIIAAVHPTTPILFFDVHAETTSEKMALGWHCDGRASAVVGTHTHVQTADERILPGGTAYITDAGMCGPEDSVIGMDVDGSLRRFRTQRPCRFEVAAGPVRLCGVVVDVEETTGRARHIERISRHVKIG